MKLILHLVGPPRLMGARQRCELGAGSLSVGRSPEADWVIPDTERLISRVHLRIDASHGAFVLTDTSANGVYVNGSPEAVGHGASVDLRGGDRLRVGAAEIVVEIEEGAQAAAPAANPFALDATAFAAHLHPHGPAADGPAPPAGLVRDPLGGPFGQGPAPARPAPRTVIDANWMNGPVKPPPPLPARAPEPDGTVVRALRPNRAGPAPGGEGQAFNPASVRALVEARPDLTPGRLAAAIDAAGQELDPNLWQDFQKKLQRFLDITII